MSDPVIYTVGWICNISVEYVAAQSFLDEIHEGPKYVSTQDNNDYTLGRMKEHNVVIAVLPERGHDVVTTAVVARDMLHSFPNIRIGLTVGIGGGAPSSKHDIRLGDIVVSSPRNGIGGVFQYDFGKNIQNQSFQPTGFLNQPPTVLRTAVNGLKSRYRIHGHQIQNQIDSVLAARPTLHDEYSRPALGTDRLYRSNIVHPAHDESSCARVCNDDPSNLIIRRERGEDEDDPAIHYGLIASGGQLMKDAFVRDKLIAERDVLCFERAAAGLMNHFPCLVIRGICNYSDSHPTKQWQGYAAMAAVAYAKDLLQRIPLNREEAQRKIGHSLSGQSKQSQELFRQQQFMSYDEGRRTGGNRSSGDKDQFIEDQVDDSKSFHQRKQLYSSRVHATSHQNLSPTTELLLNAFLLSSIIKSRNTINEPRKVPCCQHAIDERVLGMESESIGEIRAVEKPDARETQVPCGTEFAETSSTDFNRKS